MLISPRPADRMVGKPDPRSRDGRPRRGMATLASPARRSDTALEKVREKVLAGRRLDLEDGVALYKTPRPAGPGRARQPRARAAARRRGLLRLEHPHQPHERLRGHLRLLRVRRQEGRAARLHDGHLDDRARTCTGLSKTVREVHIVGGLHPDLPFAYFTDMMRGIKAVRPDIHIKAFTAVEIFFFHRLYRMSVEQVLRRAQGGRARFDARRRRRDLREGDAQQDHQGQGRRRRSGWTSCARRTSSGIPTNATMLYGHIESVEDRVDHLLKLRELQDETGGFVTYIPLAFQPWEAPAMKLPETTGFEDLKAIAVGAADARQLPAHQVVLDHDRRRGWRRSASRSAPTTSTAP